MSATLRSCNTALGEGQCQLYDGTVRRDIVFHAVVRWDLNQLELHIELRERDPSGNVVDQRDVEFAEDDAARLRWASAGLVIASLAVQHERPPDSALEVSPPRPAPARAPAQAQPIRAPTPVPERSLAPRVAFEIGAQAGTALDDGAPRLGPFLGLVLPVGSLPLQVIGSVFYARRSNEVETTWLGGALGLGVRIGSWQSPWAAELRSELVIEQITLKAQEPDTGVIDETSRVRLGSTLGLGVVWMPLEHLGLVLGGKVGVMRPEVVVRVREQSAGSVPAFGWAGSGALRLAW